MTPRRILLINHEYPPLGGGAGVATRQIARGLARLGHKPIVLTSGWEGLPATEEVDGVSIRRLQVPRTDARHARTSEAAAFIAAASFAASRLALQWKIDAAIAFFAFPGAAAGWLLNRTARLPYVIALQGGDLPNPDPEGASLAGKLADKARTRICAKAGAIVAGSEALAESARRYLPQCRIDVIPSGADVDGIKTKDDYDPRGETKLLYVGRLAKAKGLDVLLPALAMITSALKWKLTLLGDGPDWPVVAALAARHALIDRVAIHGWQGWSALPEAYRDADVFVMPSREDGIPAALLEAMATGLPVVATDVAGTNEAVLHGKTGLLVPPGDGEALADALTMLMADPSRWEAFGRAGRARIESYYSWTTVAEKWLAVIERTIAARGSVNR